MQVAGLGMVLVVGQVHASSAGKEAPFQCMLVALSHVVVSLSLHGYTESMTDATSRQPQSSSSGNGDTRTSSHALDGSAGDYGTRRTAHQNLCLAGVVISVSTSHCDIAANLLPEVMSGLLIIGRLAQVSS